MLKSEYAIVHEEKCNTCGNIDSCFQWYYLGEDNVPRVFLVECGYCDQDTEPRAAESIENLENPEMWSKANA